MAKVKKQAKNNDKAKTAKSKSPRNKQHLQLLLLALLVAIGANLLAWNKLLAPHNEKVFSQAVAQAADTHEQAVAAFIQQTQVDLRNAASQLSDIKTQRQNAEWSFFKNEGFDFKQVLNMQPSHIIDVQLYPAQVLRPDRIEANNLSFIDIDMLNKAMANADVFPEAVKQAGGAGQWLLQWATPVFANAEAIDAPQAVLLVKTSTATLQAVLTNADNSGLKLEISQTIGRSGKQQFLSVGSGSTAGAQNRAVAQSFWQLDVLPSAAFKSQNFEFPLWIMALMAVITLLCLAPVIWLMTRPAKEEKIDADTLLLREKYKQKTNKLDSEETRESPLEIAPEESVPENTQELAQVASVKRSYAVPDAIFRAYDIRGIVGEELSFELAALIGRSIASEVLAAGDTSVIVGHDARSHSPELAHHLQQGIISTGCHIIDVGLVPTPLLNFAVIFSDQSSSGIVVTASHNPKNYNGFKIIINEKSLQADDMETIKQRIINDDFKHASTPGEITHADFKEDYIDTVLADVAIGSDIKVVVDAANGASSELAPALYKDLGCDVVPLFCEFNGEFPNHDPDPCNADNLQTLIQKVIEEKATAGIALDGDGDRLVVVTPKGRIIWPDQLLMIFVKDVVARNPGCDVVFDIKSTRHLSQLISSYGGRPVMWKTGHSHIKSKMIETNALLAGEFSGHIFFKERWFGFDDGMYAAARLLEILSLSDESLDDLLTDMPKSVSTSEIKVALDDAEKMQFIERLIKESQFESGEKTLIDGLRIDFAKGWGLVRASNTSPALTLRFEGDDEDTIETLKTIFKREINKIDSRLQLDF